MQSAKQSVANVGASAKSGMDKTKATLQEKVDKMKAKDPVEKQMATERKDQKIQQAELEKKMATGPQGTGQPAGPVTDGVTASHPSGADTGTGLTTDDNPNVGGLPGSGNSAGGKYS